MTQIEGRLRYKSRKPKKDLPGFVYVVAYDSVVVKVGRTDNITRRLHQHDTNAEIHGAERVATWFRWFEDSYTAEKSLLRTYRRYRPEDTAVGKEWFIPGDFGRAANLANKLYLREASGCPLSLP